MAKIYIKESTGQRIIEQSRVRLLCVGFFFVLCFASITFKMVEIAVIKNPKAMTVTVFDPDNNEQSEQVELKSSVPIATRGDIVDRNGELLATSLMTASVFANPAEIKNVPEVAHQLGQTLKIDENLLLNRLKKGKTFVWIKRNLSPQEQDQVNRLGIPALYFQPEEKRIYPYGNLLSHALGFVGLDNKGQAGIERQFDAQLHEGTRNNQPLAISIDVRLQGIMREEMRGAVDEFHAIGATGVILDIKSGELLSMVSLPDFDPNKPSQGADAARFNRATLGAYEMGSTFKSFTMAMGLDDKVTTMKGGYDASHPLKIGTFTIHDAHSEGRFLTVPEIYAYSSNVGTARMALEIGTKRQKEFLNKIGMLKSVDIDFPEKAAPQFPAEWKEINTVTIAYGHGISVTPLHLVMGIASLVNGGTLEHLTLIKDGNKNKSAGERIIAKETSENMRRLMRLVVEHGTGGKADVSGYLVAGKTGTAEKVQTGGKYNKDAKMASFIAAFPVDDPKYVVLVMIDEPKGNKETYGFATGGWISAPVVGQVIARMGVMYGIKPRYNVPEDDAEKFWTENSEKAPKRKVELYSNQWMEKGKEKNQDQEKGLAHAEAE